MSTKTNLILLLNVLYLLIGALGDIQIPGCMNCKAHGKVKDYQACSTNISIIENYVTSQELYNQSSFERSQFVKFDASKLSLKYLFGWCINEAAGTNDLYKEWATINLNRIFLIHSTKVFNFKEYDAGFTGNRQPESFKLEFSLNGLEWTFYDKGKELNFKEVNDNGLVFNPPFIAKHVRIRIKLNRDKSKTKCIKLQLKGCEGIPVPDPTTIQPSSTTTVTSTTPQPITSQPTIASGQIESYSMRQGDIFNGNTSYVDSLYNGEVTINRILFNGTGCLTDNMTVKNPFKEPTCWIGWNQSISKENSIQIYFKSMTRLTGLKISSYKNKDLSISTINKITIHTSQSNPFNATILGHTCVPSQQKMKGAMYYTVDLSNIELKYLRISFSIQESWLFLRHITLLEGPLQEDDLKLTKKSLLCSKDKEKGKVIKGSSGSNITLILGIIGAIIIVTLTALIILYFKCRKHKKQHVSNHGQQKKTFLELSTDEYKI